MAYEAETLAAAELEIGGAKRPYRAEAPCDALKFGERAGLRL